MQRSIWYASYDSRSFSFEAAGLTEAEARATLEQGLLAHKKQYDLDDDWYELDDIHVIELELGCAYRDRSKLKVALG